MVITDNKALRHNCGTLKKDGLDGWVSLPCLYYIKVSGSTLSLHNWKFNFDLSMKSLDRRAATISVANAADVRENHKSLRCPLSRTQ